MLTVPWYKWHSVLRNLNILGLFGLPPLIALQLLIFRELTILFFVGVATLLGCIWWELTWGSQESGWWDRNINFDRLRFFLVLFGSAAAVANMYAALIDLTHMHYGWVSVELLAIAIAIRLVCHLEFL